MIDFGETPVSVQTLDDEPMSSHRQVQCDWRIKWANPVGMGEWQTGGYRVWLTGRLIVAPEHQNVLTLINLATGAMQDATAPRRPLFHDCLE